MIKFFRKMRLELMTANKTRRYLKYALGEIILVVIGILIALQINNWNEGRKQIQKSRNYLSEIVKDLQSDSLLYSKTINKLNKDIIVDTWAINELDFKADQLDSIWLSFGGFYHDQNMNVRTYQKIQNAGDTKLIGFESVADPISHYYNEIYNYIDSFTKWDLREVSERQVYMKDLEEVIEISNFQLQILGKGSITEDFPVKQNNDELIKRTLNFANSIRGRNHVKHNLARHLRLRQTFQRANDEAMELLSKIRLELDRH